MKVIATSALVATVERDRVVLSISAEGLTINAELRPVEAIAFAQGIVRIAQASIAGPGVASESSAHQNELEVPCA